MKVYTNFYETIKEANMRLQHTVVLYDGHPCYVLAITDHKNDGIYRMYLDPVKEDGRQAFQTISGIPYEWHESPVTIDGIAVYHKERGEKMDQWMEANPTSGVIRKMMNSPLFNKFRPFELGMLNTKWGAAFSQRTPVRHTQQGLTTSMIVASRVTLGDDDTSPRSKGLQMDLSSKYFLECVKNIYPSYEESMAALKDKELVVQSAAFHRNFALIKGPVNSVFLAYKEDVIGIIPTKDQVILGTEFQHCKEAVADLHIFNTIQ